MSLPSGPSWDSTTQEQRIGFSADNIQFGTTRQVDIHGPSGTGTGINFSGKEIYSKDLEEDEPQGNDVVDHCIGLDANNKWHRTPKNSIDPEGEFVYKDAANIFEAGYTQTILGNLSVGAVLTPTTLTHYGSLNQHGAVAFSTTSDRHTLTNYGPFNQHGDVGIGTSSEDNTLTHYGAFIQNGSVEVGSSGNEKVWTHHGNLNQFGNVEIQSGTVSIAGSTCELESTGGTIEAKDNVNITGSMTASTTGTIGTTLTVGATGTTNGAVVINGGGSGVHGIDVIGLGGIQCESIIIRTPGGNQGHIAAIMPAGRTPAPTTDRYIIKDSAGTFHAGHITNTSPLDITHSGTNTFSSDTHLTGVADAVGTGSYSLVEVDDGDGKLYKRNDFHSGNLARLNHDHHFSGNMTHGGTNTFNSDLITPLTTPSAASSTGTEGTIRWDANYIYVCTATDTWKRSALSTW